MHQHNEATRPINILLVEDNPGDVILTQKAFEKIKLTNNLMVAKDGEIALDMLHKRETYTNAIIPDIILLDLNLPKIDGREVLAEIKTSPTLQTIPVIILTSSNAERDVVETYHLDADCYLIKPISLDKFFKVIQAIDDFSFSIVTSHVADTIMCE